MARLLVPVVLAAAIVPTAVLGGGTAIWRGYSVRQVERAFAAQRIALHRHPSRTAPEYTVELRGRLPDRTSVDVAVFAPPPGIQRSFVTVYLSSFVASNSPPRRWGSGSRGNVTVDWETSRPCAPEAARVRAALARLGSAPAAFPSGVGCSRLNYP